MLVFPYTLASFFAIPAKLIFRFVPNTSLSQFTFRYANFIWAHHLDTAVTRWVFFYFSLLGRVLRRDILVNNDTSLTSNPQSLSNPLMVASLPVFHCYYFCFRSMELGLSVITLPLFDRLFLPSFCWEVPHDFRSAIFLPNDNLHLPKNSGQADSKMRCSLQYSFRLWCLITGLTLMLWITSCRKRTLWLIIPSEGAVSYLYTPLCKECSRIYRIHKSEENHFSKV